VSLTVASPANAQAWLPFKGEGSVALSYVYFAGGDHLYPIDITGRSTRGYVAEGKRFYLGDTTVQTMSLNFDYGLVNRVAVSGSVAYGVARYEGNAWYNFDIDDGEWHGSFQDFGLEVRAMALQHPVVFTPFVGFGSPVRNYPLSGHTATGRGLNELRLGVNLGWQLTFLPSAYLHGSYFYGIAEEVNDIRLERGVLGVQAGYFATSWLGLMGMASYQDTWGGLEWATNDPDAGDPHEGGEDSPVNQLTAARFALLGLGATFSFRDISLFTSWGTMVWGENVEEGDFLTVTARWSFSTPFAG